MFYPTPCAGGKQNNSETITHSAYTCMFYLSFKYIKCTILYKNLQINTLNELVQEFFSSMSKFQRLFRNDQPQILLPCYPVHYLPSPNLGTASCPWSLWLGNLYSLWCQQCWTVEYTKSHTFTLQVQWFCL